MKNRKITAFLLAAVSSTVLLAGCGSTVSSNQDDRTASAQTETQSADTEGTVQKPNANVSTKLSHNYSTAQLVKAFGYDPSKYVKLPDNYTNKDTYGNIEAIVQKSKIKVPDFLVDPEVDKILKQLEQIAKQSGKTLEQYVKGYSKKSLSAYRKELKAGQSKLVKQNMALAAIVQDQKMTVTKKDYDKWLDGVKEQTGNSKKGIVQAYGSEKEAVIGCAREQARTLITKAE